MFTYARKYLGAVERAKVNRHELRSDLPVVVQMMILGHRLGHLMEKRLNRIGYNHTQAAIINTLRRRPGLMAQDLVAPAHVEPPSVTRALQSLERRGLVVRQPHPTDGRASLFYLTTSGEQAAGSIMALMRDISADLEQGMTDEQRGVLRDVLSALFALTDKMRGAES